MSRPHRQLAGNTRVCVCVAMPGSGVVELAQRPKVRCGSRLGSLTAAGTGCKLPLQPPCKGPMPIAQQSCDSPCHRQARAAAPRDQLACSAKAAPGQVAFTQVSAPPVMSFTLSAGGGVCGVPSVTRARTAGCGSASALPRVSVDSSVPSLNWPWPRKARPSQPPAARAGAEVEP